MEERLKELILQLADGKADDFVQILRAAGKEVEVDDEAIYVRDKTFRSIVILRSSPVALVPQVLLALFGPFWPYGTGGLNNRLQKAVAVITENTSG